ncbi:NHLP family bacteriocin export ABC transporter peptidase/permease/ATPase subunit [Sporomusa sp. KB1]|jgi:NHLM bacteriocin system ABC transporter peptidase/ATP-binding protein|uniref:NHLP family bacteriocin export ABC transporter peptidase/permease/ATPase subunit n=1 Tax=Sporomusa sp. KB1 TaxID=943346 RepID=UPI0011AB22F3|nr:NHLP family bacteriocin export ABC transporter peptidase/permease/ATPase subunit [Sporomusa sp. KB1]TWH46390.1 NHLM bacteriocin system ABC transporter peptidase/ATP-binding protein [Sporomusa sp. KB1]
MPEINQRKKTPLMLQMEATECGAAALGIVLGHFGLFLPLEELRLTCGVSRNGSKAGNILRAAEKYGLVGQGYTYSAERLLKAPMPAIVHWGFNHFLVVEGSKNGKVYLNDPARGHRTVDLQEFEENYTGIAILVAPGKDFTANGQEPSLWKPFYEQLCRNNKVVLLFVLLIGLGTAICGMVTPVFTQLFFDEILTYLHREWLFDLLLGMAIILVIKGILNLLNSWTLTKWQGSMTIGRSAEFFHHVLHLPIEFFQQRYSGEVAARAQFAESIADFISGQLARVVLDIAIALFYLFLLFEYNVQLTIVGLLFTTLNMVVLYYSFQWLKEQQMLIQQESAKLYGLSIAGIATIETLKANGNEQDFFMKWAGFNTRMLILTQRSEYYSQLINLVPALLAGVNSAIIMMVGGFQIMDGFMSIGIFIAFQGLMGNFQEPVGRVLSLAQSVQQYHSQLVRLEDVLRYEVDPLTQSEKALGTMPSKLSGSLTMNKVSFGYSKLDKPILKQFKLELKPSKRVAIVGASGSGKSTVAKLAAGLLEPWSGEILFDNNSRQEIPRQIMASSVALVEQDISLFEGTVIENVTLFNAAISYQDIVQAAKDAEIHQDILKLSGGYDAPVAEGGYNFSGGQRQRLEIARALAENPRLLIFDEATSALDPLTEKKIMKNIRRRGCSCLIVAHRLSTIRDCEEIIVLQKGRVVQRGTHEELIAAGGAYRQLIDSEG